MGASNFWQLQLCSNLWTFGLGGEDTDICQDTIENVKSELNLIDWLYENNWAEWEWYVQVCHFQVPYYNTAWKYWDANNYDVVVEYGYYEGWRFDIIAHEDGYFSPFYMNKAYEKRLAKLIKECEKVFAKYTTPMRRVGGFSDGTSLYSKV